MSEKVTVPKEVAAAIEELREKGFSRYGVIHQASGAVFEGPARVIKRWAFDKEGGTPDRLMLALVNGYEVEQSPEDKIREYYMRCERERIKSAGSESREWLAKTVAIKTTLLFLGIKIEGINTDLKEANA
ncbi:DUF1642 domain-containing protein [Neobacillus mesonae]|uniref:Uncharacterized protein n=1 Tax=Neobacillus mesonae TaxID=1193713 RepID=A0A3Q9QT44_9BACI|nr:DUF1642 domain-containing protein [Neobacillus mesonae]AZU61012.1 hypothetical protein CHR53_06970 [Neobacillus mesonae]